MIYQLKISLLHCANPVWRRILVEGSTTLHEVHYLIQNALGWTNSHPHEFYIDGELYSAPDPEYGDDMLDENEYTLEAVCPDESSTMLYTYDFGDEWEHRIVVETIDEREAIDGLPYCSEGEGACPPEDCGGPLGYERILKILANGQDPEYDTISEQLGEEFDPKYFDIKAANNRITENILKEPGLFDHDGQEENLDEEEEW